MTSSIMEKKAVNLKNQIQNNGFLIKRFIVKGFAISILLVIYSFLEPFLIEDKVYTIQDPDIPVAFDQTRIIFLSDIHHGRFFSRKRLRKLVGRVNRLNADLILLGGDYVEGRPKYIKGCFEELGRLYAPLGVYGVLGNHDHWQGADITRKEMRNEGIKSIDNGAFWINKKKGRIRIGGVGDHCEDVQNLNETVDNVTIDDFVILVSHSPDYSLELESDKVDLIFSGHTHGGQVTFFGIFAPKLPSRYGQKFRTGKVEVNSMNVVISNGIGTAFLPLRFFARPQIVIVQLEAS